MRLTVLALSALFTAQLAAPALAERNEHDFAARVTPLPAYSQECASCHLAYPPALLPAATWQRLMQNLPRHFGTDASLDAPRTQQISAWLQSHAGSGRRAQEAPPEDRVTRAAWFVRKHREVAAEVWKRPAVRSASQCGACHPAAAEGRFSEHDIRIPR
jgi:hypothetical protein